MKAKDYIIIGGAIALYLLWKKKKDKKVTTSTTTEGGSSSAPSGSASAPTGASQTTSTPTSNEPEQIFGASLPSGMDLPVLTAGTGVATEVAVQQGLGNTTPTPAIVPPKTLATMEALEISDIKPIVKDTTTPVATLDTITYNTPRPQPSVNPKSTMLEP